MHIHPLVIQYGGAGGVTLGENSIAVLTKRTSYYLANDAGQ